MDLYLSQNGCDVEVRLRLPADREDIWAAEAELAQYSTSDKPMLIWRAVCPVGNLTGYLRRADLNSESYIQKLNALAMRIDGMSQQEQRIFSGALDSESINGLDDVLRVAENLGQFELIEGVTSDRALSGWLVENDQLNVKFPQEVLPYLDYAGIGAEYYANHGGAYSPDGYVRRRENNPELTEANSVLTLTLANGNGAFSVKLPISDERLTQVKVQLGLDDFAQVKILKVEADPNYAPLSFLLPTDCISVEEANDLALCVEAMSADEQKTYCAALSAEGIHTFSAAVSIAMDIDDYESVSSNEWEYGRAVLRRTGADDEVLDMLDGYTDFVELGRAMMEEDGVRRTEFGLVRRISVPFEEQAQMGQQMQ